MTRRSWGGIAASLLLTGTGVFLLTVAQPSARAQTAPDRPVITVGQPDDPLQRVPQSLYQEQPAALSTQMTRPFTVLDEIEDPAERKAFRLLHRKRNPEKRRRMAENFLRDYPQSWFLAQAWEIAAKASLDLEDYDKALRYSRQSLRLLPENPALLVPLAALQAQQGKIVEAASNARLALEYLDYFGAPSGFSEKDWTIHEGELRACSYYILGKAAAAEGLRATDRERKEKLQQAEHFFQRSWQLNSNDARTAYLLGLTRMAQNKVPEAAVAFATAYRQGGAFGAKAGERLRGIHKLLFSSNQKEFDVFLAGLATVSAESDDPGSQSDVRPGRLHSAAAEYAGSASCRSCHPRHYAAWKQTGHARMFRPYKFENVSGNFEDQTYEDNSGRTVARMSHDQDQHYFEVRGSSGSWRRYRVDYTIGSKWQQTYATQLPNAEIHVFPLQYSMLEKRWVAFWKKIDPPDSQRAIVSNFPNHSWQTAYLVNCGPCHTSQLRTTVPGKLEAKHLRCREGGINCEMCHGPSASHVASMRTAGAGGKGPLKILQLGEISSRDHVAICGQCHMQSGRREPGSEGEINYVASHDAFFVGYRSRPYTDFLRKAFYKDGRFRVVTFIVESFFRSECFRKGNAHCGHCHDHHPADVPANNRGLKFLGQPDQMCLQCHPKYETGLEDHTLHPAASEGSRCVACHMPAIMNSVLFKTRTHRIDNIPDAEMTTRFGHKDSPNACLICHAEKDEPWAEAELKKW